MPKVAAETDKEKRSRAKAERIRRATEAKRFDSVRRVTLPVSGEEVEVRSVTEGDRIECAQKAENKDELFLHLLCQRSCFDPETGDPIFVGEDAGMLKEMMTPDVRAITDAVLEVSILTPKAFAAVGNA
jgi:hypothetical protein